MDIRFQVALDNALIYAHQLMRRVGRFLSGATSHSLSGAPQGCDPAGGREGERADPETGGDSAGELAPVAATARPAEQDAADPAGDPPRTGRPGRTRALPLIEPPVRMRPSGPMPAGLFDTVSPDDAVPAGRLLARLARLRATLANPLARARRLALWRRRMAATGRQPLRRRLALPRPVGDWARHLAHWLAIIDAETRTALMRGPG